MSCLIVWRKNKDLFIYLFIYLAAVEVCISFLRLPGCCGGVYLVPIGVGIDPQPATRQQCELAKCPVFFQVLQEKTVI